MSCVYVILVNWNGWRDTVECLESVLRSDHGALRVVVCDNASRDGSLARLKEWAQGRLEPVAPPERLRHLSHPPLEKPIPFLALSRAEAESGRGGGDGARLVFIDNGANLGFAGGNNVGLRYAMSRDDFGGAWLLNNDTVVAPDTLSRLLERLRQRPRAGLIGSTLLWYGDPGRVQALGGAYYCRWIGLPWHLGRLCRARRRVAAGPVERRMNYVVGASIFVTGAFLRQVGLMCEDYFLYFEELDWALRSRGRFELAWAPESVVYHKVGKSIGTSSRPGRKSVTCDYYNVRNRILFTRRFFPYALPTVYLVLCGTLVTRLLLGRWDRAWLVARLMLGRAADLPDRALAAVPEE